MAAISSTLPEPMSVAGSGRGRRWRTSATTWPPALSTSSRNSARDSSASNPGESTLGEARPGARGPGEIDGANERSEGGGDAVCGASRSTEPGAEGPAAKRSPGVALPLPGERASRSTATRTARSGALPRRPRSADEGCELPTALPELDVVRASREARRVAKRGAKGGAPALMLFRGRLRDRLHRRRNCRRTDTARYCRRTVLAVHDAAIAYHG